MNELRRGLRLFAYDMRQSVPLQVTFLIALIAFALAFAAITGFRF